MLVAAANTTASKAFVVLGCLMHRTRNKPCRKCTTEYNHLLSREGLDSSSHEFHNNFFF
jgi:hypothetical protein